MNTNYIEETDADLVIVFSDNSARRYCEDDSLDELCKSFPDMRLIRECHIVDVVPVGATVLHDAGMDGGIEDRLGTIRRYAIALPRPDHRVSPDSYAPLVELLSDSVNMLNEDRLRSMLVKIKNRAPQAIFSDVMDLWVDGLCDEEMIRQRRGGK